MNAFIALFSNVFKMTTFLNIMFIFSFAKEKNIIQLTIFQAD